MSKYYYKNMCNLFRKKNSKEPLLYLYDMKGFQCESCPNCGSRNATLYYQDATKYEFMCHDCRVTPSNSNLFTILENERKKNALQYELHKLKQLPLSPQEKEKMEKMIQHLSIPK